jgi:hypothetical protein
MNHVLHPLQLIISGGFWQTLMVCLIICPVIPQLLGVVFCSYWVPWDPHYQFLSYVPGNPCLALFIAGASTELQHGTFTISPLLNWACIVGAIVACALLTYLDAISEYSHAQMLSANKVYHNLLYSWYGYLTFVCFIGLLSADASVGRKLLIMVPGLFWLLCLGVDNFVPGYVKILRTLYAHADTYPIWRRWKLRHRTESGYGF